MSIFARSTASMTAGEQTANASTMPAPAVTRPMRSANDTNIAAINNVDRMKVCDWSRPSAPRRSHGRKYISGRCHGSRGFSYSGS
jgi:hypothetical protein